MKLVCFQHPYYRGTDSPILACKTCCSIFVGKLKAESAEAEASTKGDSQDEPKTKYMPKKANVAFYQKGLR